MRAKLIIDGNAFYEIDEECMEKKKQHEQEEERRFIVEESVDL